MDWDPEFAGRSPMLEPLRAYAEAFRGHRDWPDPGTVQALFDERGLTNAGGAALRLVEPANGAYEERIRSTGEMAFRAGGWHDLFNALAWLAYPAAKAALNDEHVNWSRTDPTSSQRGRRRDALTLFDENGAIVLSSDESLLEDVRAFRWKRLFVERRDAVCAGMRVHVFGHALFEKALEPYVGLTAHALLVAVPPDVLPRPPDERTREADRHAAAAIRTLASPQALSPLPVLGVPGWWPANEDAAFYDNTVYFRSGRRAG